MNRLEIRIAGTRGQGLILASKMLAAALAASGWRVAQSQTYGPTSRGGFCNAERVIASEAVDYSLATWSRWAPLPRSAAFARAALEQAVNDETPRSYRPLPRSPHPGWLCSGRVWREGDLLCP
jgi:hypothetical protein